MGHWTRPTWFLLRFYDCKKDFNKHTRAVLKLAANEVYYDVFETGKIFLYLSI